MPTTFVPDPVLLASPRGRSWPAAPAAAARPRSGPPASADVVVVGAGPAGLAVACALWHLGVPDVVLLDRGGRPCGRFFDRIDALDQRVLRSPYEHHPGVEGFRDCELLDFARLHWARLTPVERREVRMSQSGHRSVVPVDVFEAFCAHVAAVHDVGGRTWPVEVTAVSPDEHGAMVRGRVDGAVGGAELAVRARFVVLCQGEETTTAPASWWGGGPPPAHVSYWDLPRRGAGRGRVGVIGAGLTAAHLITTSLAAGHSVDWIVREPRERYQCADVNARFFRPEGRATFSKGERTELLRAHRRASIMFEFRPALLAAEEDGALVVHRGAHVTEVGAGPSGVRIGLRDRAPVSVDHLVLALGTTPSTGRRLLPEGVVGDGAAWPDLDERTLAFTRARRVLAVGAATAMVLGPAARNIDGHRLATARVAATVAAGLRARGDAPAPEAGPLAAVLSGGGRGG